MSSIVLTSPQGGGGIPGTIVTDVAVPHAPPNNVQIIDSCSCTQNSSVKWIYTIKSPSQDKILTGEVLGLHRAGTNPSHTKYAMIGDRNWLPHRVDVINIAPSQLAIEITNLSENLPNPTDYIDYTINIVRIQML